jgi:hypothetical protein
MIVVVVRRWRRLVVIVVMIVPMVLLVVRLFDRLHHGGVAPVEDQHRRASQKESG